MKKGSVLRYLLSSACILSLIGTGFAIWQFNDVLKNQKSLKLKAKVATASEEGEISFTLPEGYTTFNLILEQTNGAYNTQSTGVYFVPNIKMTYRNYAIDEGVAVKLTGEIEFNNEKLEKYIAPINLDNQYFLSTFITEDLKSTNEYKRSIIPEFKYQDGMEPITSGDLKAMINELSNSSNGEYDLTIKLNISFNKVG